MSLSSVELNRLLASVARGKEDAAEELQTAIASELNQTIGVRIAADREVLKKQRHSERDYDYEEKIDLIVLVWDIWQRVAERESPERRTLFIVSAAEAIRRVLLQFFRRRDRYRGEQLPIRVKLSHFDRDGMESIEEARQKLEAIDVRKAELLKLRYFMNLRLHEVADVLQIPAPRCMREWQEIRTWYAQELGYSTVRRKVEKPRSETE